MSLYEIDSFHESMAVLIENYSASIEDHGEVISDRRHFDESVRRFNKFRIYKLTAQFQTDLMTVTGIAVSGEDLNVL